MGKLIVVDGLDGSGKKTQVELLVDRLKKEGKKVYLVDFPDYDSDSSMAVKMYLRGDLGNDPSKLNPYMCSLFYTVDRAIQFVKWINKAYSEEDSILIANRYISANIIHQGCKLESKEDKTKFFDWIYDIEVNKIGLPRDDLTIILSVPVETSQKLLEHRYNNHNEKKDIHEANVEYLKKCYNTVDIAIDHLSSMGYNWVRIDCSDGKDGVKSIADIEKDIWNYAYDIINR